MKTLAGAVAAAGCSNMSEVCSSMSAAANNTNTTGQVYKPVAVAGAVAVAVAAVAVDLATLGNSPGPSRRPNTHANLQLHHYRG